MGTQSWIKQGINFMVKTFKNFQNLKKKTYFIQASNPWWRPMKGPKTLETILGNSSTKSNLKLINLAEKLKGF